MMSAPFGPIVERTERQKCSVIEKKNLPQYMPHVSNFEEIVFFTSSSRCLLDEIKTIAPSPKVDYDKYLEFFE